MSGKPGQSGKTPSNRAKFARGRFRADRHRVRLAVARAAPSAAPAVLGPIPPKLREGLDDPGRQFLADEWLQARPAERGCGRFRDGATPARRRAHRRRGVARRDLAKAARCFQRRWPDVSGSLSDACNK